MSRSCNSRGGFTLVELLVVIAIIGILVGLLLPAVQMIREAARRTQCSNNIRQLALAVHNHESAFRRFPVNQIGPGVSDGSGGFRSGFYSWLVPLLPYVEQDSVHDSFSLSINNGDGNGYRVSSAHPNAAAVAARIPLFLCPSDTPSLDNVAVMGTANPAPGNYAGNAGWPSYATGFLGERPVPGLSNGAIALRHPSIPVPWHRELAPGFQDIEDGSSRTALVSERLVQPASSAAEVNQGDERLKAHHILERFQTLPEIEGEVATSHTHVFESAHIGRSWSTGFPLAAPTYLHVKTPNTEIGFYNTSRSEGDFVMTASSFHPGGVNLAMVDGSTSFVDDNVSREVWWAIGGINDGRIESLGE